MVRDGFGDESGAKLIEQRGSASEVRAVCVPPVLPQPGGRSQVINAKDEEPHRNAKFVYLCATYVSFEGEPTVNSQDELAVATSGLHNLRRRLNGCMQSRDAGLALPGVPQGECATRGRQAVPLHLAQLDHDGGAGLVPPSRSAWPTSGRPYAPWSGSNVHGGEGEPSFLARVSPPAIHLGDAGGDTRATGNRLPEPRRPASKMPALFMLARGSESGQFGALPEGFVPTGSKPGNITVGYCRQVAGAGCVTVELRRGGRCRVSGARFQVPGLTRDDCRLLKVECWPLTGRSPRSTNHCLMAALTMFRKRNGLVFGVKMSQPFISLEYKELARKSGPGAEKRPATLHDVIETKRVSNEWKDVPGSRCQRPIKL